MEKMLSFLALISLLIPLSACGGGSQGGQQSSDYDVVSQKFMNALFEKRLTDAMVIVLDDYKEDMREDINLFANLADKYDFKDNKIQSVRGWKTSNVETDKRIEIVFQYAPKGTTSWAIGALNIRVLNANNMWGVADLLLVIPNF